MKDIDQARLAEYESLRREILDRIRYRQHVIYIALVAFGALLGLDFPRSSETHTPIVELFLVYPVIATALAVIYLQNDERIHDIARYIREKIESKVVGLDYETDCRKDRLKRLPEFRTRMRQVLVKSHIAPYLFVFILTSGMSLGFGWAMRDQVRWPTMAHLLLAASLVCVAWLMSHWFHTSLSMLRNKR